MERILISSCLLGKMVRYNGGHCYNSNQILRNWHETNILVPFCPEVSSGLPTPRLAAELQNFEITKMLSGEVNVMDKNHNNITNYYHDGAQKALQLCMNLTIKMAILKEYSPSCGVQQIYDGSFSGTKINGMGVTTFLLKQFNIEVFSEFQLHEAFEFYQTLNLQLK